MTERHQMPPGTRALRFKGAVFFHVPMRTATCPRGWDGERLTTRLLHSWWCRRCRQNTREHDEQEDWLREATLKELAKGALR